jgi:EpsI family protein
LFSQYGLHWYDAEVSQTYQKDGHRIGVYLIYYRAQRQGAELINSRNRIVKSGKWQKVAGSERKPIRVPGLAIDVMKTRLYSAEREILAYNWNWFDGQYVFSPYLAKLMELKGKLLGRQLPGAAIVIFTDYREEGEAAEQALQSFIADMLPAIERELNEAATQNGQLE